MTYHVRYVTLLNMKKEEAIKLFGTVTKLAKALEITTQAISQWPSELSKAISDRVELAAIKHKPKGE